MSRISWRWCGLKFWSYPGSAWFYHDWDFVNRFGVREWGVRVLGVEVSNFREVTT